MGNQPKKNGFIQAIQEAREKRERLKNNKKAKRKSLKLQDSTVLYSLTQTEKKLREMRKRKEKLAVYPRGGLLASFLPEETSVDKRKLTIIDIMNIDPFLVKSFRKDTLKSYGLLPSLKEMKMREKNSVKILHDQFQQSYKRLRTNISKKWDKMKKSQEFELGKLRAFSSGVEQSRRLSSKLFNNVILSNRHGIESVKETYEKKYKKKHREVEREGYWRGVGDLGGKSRKKHSKSTMKRDPLWAAFVDERRIQTEKA